MHCGLFEEFTGKFFALFTHRYMSAKIQLHIKWLLIRSTTRVYPAERRAFSTAVMKGEANFAHWRLWGRYAELENQGEDLKIEWHFPSSEELSVAVNLALSELEAPLKTLQTVIDSKDMTDKLDDDVIKALNAVIAVARGCSTVLGVIDGNDDGLAARSVRSDHGVPLILSQQAAMLPPITITVDGQNITLRSHLADVAHSLAVHYQTVASEAARTNVKLVAKIMKLMEVLVVGHGAMEVQQYRTCTMTR